ncbi:MAG: GGDEF domain-containing protein, partial [Gammaproteobacteria bacterium]
MSFYKRTGTRGMVMLVTVVSVLGSMLLTMGLIYPLAAPEVAKDGFWYFLGGSVGVPLLIAPVATLLIARLLVLLQRSFEVVKSLSTTDPLTGSANRRGFFSLAEQNIRTLRGNHICGVGMVDLNDFKILNDAHGHKAGDTALVNIAQALQKIIGEAGTVGRIGGDEFALLIIAEPARFEQIRAQIVKRCTQLVFTTASGQHIGLSASVGIVQLGEDESFDEALA